MSDNNPGIHPSRRDSMNSMGDPGVRPRQPVFPVWAPDGHVEHHTQTNINDLVRHGTVGPDGRMHKWSETPPAADAAPAAAATPVAVAAPEVEDKDTGPRAPTPELDALRAELRTLGGIPDAKWGKQHLQGEIDKHRAAAMSGKPLEIPKHLREDTDDDAS